MTKIYLIRLCVADEVDFCHNGLRLLTALREWSIITYLRKLRIIKSIL